LTIHFAPGQRFSYSGEGFVYLARVVEHVAGKSLNDFMTEMVFLPLGLTSSSYVWRGDYDARTAKGHDADGQVKEETKPKEANAAASLHTTAKDYALFVEAVLNGVGLRPKTLAEMEAPQIAVDRECTNCTERVPVQLSKNLFGGLGWGIQRTEQGDSLWHWGDNGWFKCLVVAFPKQKIGVVLFTDGENGMSIGKDVVHETIGGEQPAFAWIKYDSYDSAAMRFGKALREKGAAAAIEEFRPALKSGEITERSINSAGYRLLVQKKTAEAIQLFRLNAELYPKSSNVYDSLGAAYKDQGDKEQAIQNYEKSLELDPKNGNAVDMLKKLREN